MNKKEYDEPQGHRFFAASIFNRIWDLLEKEKRTKHDDETMVHAAHASCYHWLQVGTGLHHQRGEWMIARVYSVLRIAEAALRHANRCLELTHEHADLMEDFDQAFAYECMARANALAGRRDDALEYLRLAEKAGERISGEEDRELFISELNGGDWHGLM